MLDTSSQSFKYPSMKMLIHMASNFKTLFMLPAFKWIIFNNDIPMIILWAIPKVIIFIISQNSKIVIDSYRKKWLPAGYL